MNKLKLGILLVISLLAISGIAMAQGEKADDKVRVIAPTTSFVDKVVFRMKGCSIIHELNDATALKCPAGIAKKLDVREDRIFQIVDLEADQQIHADDVWAEDIDGTGINVAVLDTGIDMDHPELDDCYIDGYDYVDDDNIPEDWHGHGTHVSGIITADGVDSDAKGVAPGAGIYMYKVCGTYGCYESDMMAAMDAAVLTDAKVMSISIGGGNFAGENCDSDPLAAKVNWVANQGITVVVASGNDRFFVSSPACASGAIAVGATDKTGLMASFSNFGPSLDIVAPGVSIYSSVIGGYADMTGTSMSTPHVSGTVALMLEANSTLTTDQIKTALYDTANDIAADSICYGVVRQRGINYWIGEVECTSDNYGAGIVNAYGAVNAVIPEEPVCGDGIINQVIEQCDESDLAEETCTDLEFDYGTLSCTTECLYDTSACVYAVCGNDNAEPTELCDGTDLSGESCDTQGFDIGVLGCNSDCLEFNTDGCYDYECGNGLIEGSEECDNTNLGNSDCENFGFDGGDLNCYGPGTDNECTFDTSGCTTNEPDRFCGDGTCDGNFEGQLNGEDCRTCPSDCPSAARGVCCGDGKCDIKKGEDSTLCPIDCGA